MPDSAIGQRFLGPVAGREQRRIPKLRESGGLPPRAIGGLRRDASDFAGMADIAVDAEIVEEFGLGLRGENSVALAVIPRRIGLIPRAGGGLLRFGRLVRDGKLGLDGHGLVLLREWGPSYLRKLRHVGQGSANQNEDHLFEHRFTKVGIS